MARLQSCHKCFVSEKVSHLSFRAQRGICFSFSLMKFAAASPCSGAACCAFRWFEQGSLSSAPLFSRGEKEKGRNRLPTVSPKDSIPHPKHFASTIYVYLPAATWPS